MPARRAEDLWQQLVGEAGEDESERAAGVSVAQAEKELAEAGFDVAAERAKATALVAEMESGSPASAKGASRATRRRRVVAVGAALLAAVTIAAIAAVIAIPHGGVVSSPLPVGELKKRAAEIRRDAFAACDAQRYRDCETRLDEARALDPEGEQATEVQARRRLLKSPPRGP